MPRRKSTTAEPPLKREILDAACDLFTREGLEAVSMRKVGAAVGCSATAIYLYFQDKDALVGALVLEDFLDLAKELENLKQVPSPMERLRQLALAYARYAIEKPNHYRFLFMTVRPPLSPEAASSLDRPEKNAYLHGRAAALEALTLGCLRPEYQDADALVQSLLAVIHGVVSLHITNFSSPWIPWKPLEMRINLALDAFFRGIQK